MIEHNGKMYARVSEVLQPLVDFGGADPEVVAKKATVGTNVHEAINEELGGGFPVLGAKERGYFKSWQKWNSILKPAFLETEMRYYDDKLRLTGCIDGLIQLQGEKEATLIDYKTSVQESPIVWPMQAHLYHHLLINAGKEIAPKFIFLKLDRYSELPKAFVYKFDVNLMGKCLQAVKEFWRKQKQ